MVFKFLILKGMFYIKGRAIFLCQKLTLVDLDFI